LLLQHLHREQEIINTWWPRAVWGAGLLTGAVVFATQSPSTLSGYDEWAEEQMNTWRVPTTVLLGAMGGLEGASFFLDEPVQWALNDFQFSILYLGFGAAMLGAWGHNGTTRLTTGAVFGTGVALGALELVELSTRQSGRLRFGAVEDQLAGWDDRQGEDGLAQAESVLRDGSHPYWHYLCIGGIVAGGAMVAITPALVDSTNQREKETAGSVGAVMLAIPVRALRTEDATTLAELLRTRLSNPIPAGKAAKEQPPQTQEPSEDAKPRLAPEGAV
jgi:hypothetical protein